MDTHKKDSRFKIPEKSIKNQGDLEEWIRRGESYHGYVSYIEELGQSVKGIKVSDDYHVSDVRIVVLSLGILY